MNTVGLFSTCSPCVWNDAKHILNAEKIYFK